LRVVYMGEKEEAGLKRGGGGLPLLLREKGEKDRFFLEFLTPSIRGREKEKKGVDKGGKRKTEEEFDVVTGAFKEKGEKEEGEGG